MMIPPPRSPGVGSQTSSVVCGGQKFGPISSIEPSRALYCSAQPGSQECTVSQRSSPHQTCQDTSDASRTSQMMSDEPFIFFPSNNPFAPHFVFPTSMELAQVSQSCLVKPTHIFWLPGVIQSFLHKGKPSAHEFCADLPAPAEQLKPEL